MARNVYTGQAETLGPLFAPRNFARRTDPQTSKDAATRAAHAIEGEALDVLRALVGYLDCWGSGGTSRQIAGNYTSDAAFRFVAAKRLSVLEKAGLAKRVGETIDPESGRAAETWEPTDAGVARAGQRT